MTNEQLDVESARDLIKHENDLFNHRLMWFILLQGFLFSSLGFAWGKSPALIYVLCGLGGLTSLSIFSILHAGDGAIKQIINEVKEEDRWKVIGYRATPKRKITFPWFTFPLFLGVAWISIIFIKFFS